MGATSFENEYRGPLDMKAAYLEVREQALYDHGHAGYTGTIAETPGVILDPATPSPVDLDVAMKRAQFWEREDDGQPAPQKWEAAWAVPLKPNPDYVADPKAYWQPADQTQPGWLFYGLASC